MRIVLLHNAVSENSGPDEADVLFQVNAVAEAVAALGHASTALSCDADLAALKRRLDAEQPDLVFNLVESLDGHGRLIHLAPSALEAWNIPYTGAPAEAMLMTSNKILAKERMEQAGLPTPAWIGPYPVDHHWRMARAGEIPETLWIIKSVWEHASLGLEEDALARGENAESLAKILENRAPGLGGACFGERFIDGREFNLSVLAGPHGPEVLAPAEILFTGAGPKTPKIVGYRAKWDVDSPEYQNTPRSFDIAEKDAELLAGLSQKALACWRAFGLKGYARVDFRVDGEGRIYILEVNANPCISPDAGFAAALARSNISFPAAVARIIDDARTPVRAGQGAEAFLPGPAIPEAALGKSGPELVFRHAVNPEDVDAVRILAAATGFFYPSEVAVAAELVEERLAKGESSGYFFTFCEIAGRLAGFTIFGPIPCTADGFDLYWIAVAPEHQGKGLGKILMERTEGLIRTAGGRRIYIETSDRPQYAGTRKFYAGCGYRRAALLPDFYGPDDAKAVYEKILTRT